MADTPFIKTHGLGNDFVLIDDGLFSPSGTLSGCEPGALARALCHRRFGIGADGLLLVSPPSGAGTCRMRIFNANGSEAQMCGNGIRCVARYVFTRSPRPSRTILVETLAGLRTVEIDAAPDGAFLSATVDMGRPCLVPADIPLRFKGEAMIDAPIDAPLPPSIGPLRLTAISMGNPHGVVFVPDVASFPLSDVGPLLENLPIWPEKANIEFVQPLGPSEVAVRTWERGAGETLACGTGACAAAAAFALTRPEALWPVRVALLGGTLTIRRSPSGSLLMTGPAEELFKGVWTTPF